MMYRSLLAVLAVPLALASCNQAPEQSEVAAPDLPEASALSPQELAVLDSSDCREVAEAYIGAVRRGAYDYAAMFWDDPVIDGARLAALFHGYAAPQIELANVQEEGAAGTRYCTVTGALTDGENAQMAPRQGVIVLSRANGVPEASPQQLRWTIRSSTFIEPMQRAGRGEVA